MITKTIDAIIGAFSPKIALSRAIARERLTELSYHAARPTRERPLTPIAGNVSPNSSREQRDRVQLMIEARELTQNFPLVSGLLSKLALYTFGSVRYQARTSDKNINAAYEAYFDKWASKCDLSERMEFEELINSLFLSMLRDGDVGANLVRTESGIKIQPVEADRIGHPFEGSSTETYTGGVKIDDQGRPVFYRVYKRTKEGQYTDPQEMPAEQFIHLLDFTRSPDQVRGITALASAIDTARDVYDIVRYEKHAVKWASAQTGIVRTPSGDADTWNRSQSKDANGNPLEKIEFGTLNYLREGEDITHFRNERPSVTFSGFMEVLQRDVCLGMGVPYGFFVDPNAGGGASVRLESQQANRVCARYQRIFKRRFLDRVKDAVIAYGIQFDGLPSCPDWKAAKWQFPAWPSSDAGRETTANIEEWRSGLRTASDIFAERNEDWEEQFQQLGHEQKRLKEIADEIGIPIEQISARFPNQQTTPTPDGKPQAPTGTPAATDKDSLPVQPAA